MSAIHKIKSDLIKPRPLLKWAGGKSQLLAEIIPKVPSKYGKYIEPFFGGGALFFSLNPEVGVIADVNDELINLYNTARLYPELLINALKIHSYNSEHYYEVRSLDWTKLNPVDAAARTIFLNRTCFNGLYRVNKKGQFNVPFGRHINPRICDEEGINSASAAFENISILCQDYKKVLSDSAERGDFIFLDLLWTPQSRQ